MSYYTYILASGTRATLYVGMTNDLVRRVHEHKENVVAGFTKSYSVHMLVHFEIAETAAAAIRREKRLKKWKRQWKIDLIEKNNPTWRDLYGDIVT